MEEIFVKIFSFLQNFNITLIGFELLVCFHLPKRKGFLFRLLLPVLFGLVFCKELSIIMPWHVYGQFSKIPWLVVGDVLNFGFVILFAFSFLCMLFCFRAPAAKLLSFCAVAYSLQNLTFHINLLIQNCIFGGEKNFLLSLISQMVIFLVFALVYLFFVTFYKKYPNFNLQWKFAVVYSLMMLVVTSGFSYWVYYYKQYNIMLGFIAIMSNIFLIVIHFCVYLKSKVDAETHEMEEILRKGQWQQQTYRSNLEIINRKCHDLKYELLALKNMGDSEERASYISGLERTILDYEKQIQCGNGTLDVLLTDKNYRCDANGIEFSCIVDGAAMNFMGSLDTTVLFGNAIDNAIEAELKEQAENRRISLNVKKKGSIVTVNVDNYFSGTLRQDASVPFPRIATTKEDESYHGFGLRSIWLITDKYGGTMRIGTENSHFRLLLMFQPKEKDLS